MAKKMRNSDIPVCRIEMKTRRRKKIEKKIDVIGNNIKCVNTQEKRKGKNINKEWPKLLQFDERHEPNLIIKP